MMVGAVKIRFGVRVDGAHGLKFELLALPVQRAPPSVALQGHAVADAQIQAKSTLADVDVAHCVGPESRDAAESPRPNTPRHRPGIVSALLSKCLDQDRVFLQVRVDLD